MAALSTESVPSSIAGTLTAVLQSQQAGTPPGAVAINPLAMQASALGAATGAKDSRWLTLEVCREFQRSKCSRNDEECKFAHPPPHVEIVNGRVTACYDSIKGRCTRKEPPCKYLHPPQHLREQLLQNGKNNLILRNLQMQQAALGLTTLPATAQQVLPLQAGLYPGLQGVHQLPLLQAGALPAGTDLTGVFTTPVASDATGGTSSPDPQAGKPESVGKVEVMQPGLVPAETSAQQQLLAASTAKKRPLEPSSDELLVDPNMPGVFAMQPHATYPLQLQGGMMPMIKRPALDPRAAAAYSMMPGLGTAAGGVAVSGAYQTNSLAGLGMTTAPGGIYAGGAAATMLPAYNPYLQQVQLQPGAAATAYSAAAAAGVTATPGTLAGQVPQYLPISADFITGHPSTLQRF